MEEKGGQEKFRHVESFRPRELARRVIPSIDDSPAQECTARTGALATAERTRVQSTRRGRREGLSNRAKETVDGIDFSPAKLGHSFERCRSRSHCTRCNVAGMVVSLEELATFITANTRSPRTAAFYSPAGGSAALRRRCAPQRAATRRGCLTFFVFDCAGRTPECACCAEATALRSTITSCVTFERQLA